MRWPADDCTGGWRARRRADEQTGRRAGEPTSREGDWRGRQITASRILRAWLHLSKPRGFLSAPQGPRPGDSIGMRATPTRHRIPLLSIADWPRDALQWPTDVLDRPPAETHYDMRPCPPTATLSARAGPCAMHETMIGVIHRPEWMACPASFACNPRLAEVCPLHSIPSTFTGRSRSRFRVRLRFTGTLAAPCPPGNHVPFPFANERTRPRLATLAPLAKCQVSVASRGRSIPRTADPRVPWVTREKEPIALAGMPILPFPLPVDHVGSARRLLAHAE
jgi:hypothetical protein